jgi:DNA-binding MurR/RpiR family transcriptional regulator
MPHERRPGGDEDISAAIARVKSSLTKLEMRIAAYLSGRPEALVVETSAELAAKLDVSPMTVTRFFKKLGFDSSAAARANLKSHLFGPSASRIGQRFESFAANQSADDAEADFAVAAIGVRRALELRATPLWKNAVELVAGADSVCAIGFQTMRYLADGLCLRLRYVRGNVHLLDGGDGVYADLLADPTPHRTLIIIDTFRYAAHGPILAQIAAEQGVEVIVFCDEFCEWAANLTPHVLMFPPELRFFVGLPTGIHFALNLLVQDVIKSRGSAVSEQLQVLSQAQDAFGLFIK